jgi:hypothetical protein
MQNNGWDEFEIGAVATRLLQVLLTGVLKNQYFIKTTVLIVNFVGSFVRTSLLSLVIKR